MIDKIVMSVVVLMVVIFASLFLFTSYFKGLDAEQTLHRMSYEQDFGELYVTSLLQTNENDSLMSYEALLVKALRAVDTVVLIDGEEIDVEAEFQEVLDATIGRGNYYFRISPLLQGVSISYVIDGSQTMAPARAQINDALPGLVAELKSPDLFGPDAKIYSHIYILDDPAENPCGQFTFNIQDADCTPLFGDAFYQNIMQYAYSPPYPAPFRSYTEWSYDEHPTYVVDHMTKSDWASASAYASILYQQDELERVSTNKHIIVVVADELATTSKADLCFTVEDASDYIVCTVCDAACPDERADRVINETVKKLTEDDLFLGFYDFTCEYGYPAGIDDYPITDVTCAYLDQANACVDPDGSPAGVNWCDQTNCGGCTDTIPPESPVEPPIPPGSYCFHRNCDRDIIADMQKLADETQGAVFALNDLDQLTSTIYDYFIQSVTEFNFTIGTYSPSRDRYVVQKDIALASGDKVRVEFWIYD